MKWLIIFAISACVVVGAGCNMMDKADEQERQINVGLAQWFNDSAINNAIISQHTLFPYHFVDNSPMLNELGKRDLEVLAAHYKQNPGRLNVRQGSVEPELYEARLNTVVKALVDAGIEQGCIAISDGLPGGEGLKSERVLTIMEEEGKGTKARYTFEASGTP